MPGPLLLGGLLAGLLASPEALAEVRKRIIDGISVTEHLDENDSPCGGRSWLNGCYANRNGEHHVWYSEISPDFVKAHELAHAKGMTHTDWQPERNGLYGALMNCAFVTNPAEQYEPGDKICVTPRGEIRTPLRGLLDTKGK